MSMLELSRCRFALLSGRSGASPDAARAKRDQSRALPEGDPPDHPFSVTKKGGSGVSPGGVRGCSPARVANFTALAMLLALASPAFAQTKGPGLGAEVTAADMAAWDISITPTGRELPAGSGSVAQGEAVYTQHCAACHGAKGAGKPNDPLVGGRETLKGPQPVMKTVGSYWPYASTLFDYVRRAMPLGAPQSLSNDEVYAVTAYILQLNGIVGEQATMDAKTLAAVRMPNRDGFKSLLPAGRPPAP